MQKQKTCIRNGIFYLIYFIFGCAGSLLLRRPFSSCSKQGPLSRCGTWMSRYRGFPHCGSWALGLSGFSSCSGLQFRALEHRFSSVAHRLSGPTARGIFNQGPNSCLLHWQTDSLPLSHQGSPTKWNILDYVFHCSTNNTHCISQVFFCK